VCKKAEEKISSSCGNKSAREKDFIFLLYLLDHRKGEKLIYS
jgi:hypothetical protein